jgi:hypothetical protein
MTKKIDKEDQGILNYRPKIRYIEPKFDGPPPEGLPERLSPQKEDDKFKIIDNLAQAGRILAEAVQAKVDIECDSFYIDLDPIRDKHVIDALRRRFKIDKPRITYRQYKECREGLSQRGNDVAETLIPDQDEIQRMRANPEDIPIQALSDSAKAGLNRPELTKQGQVIEPIDIEEFQDMLLCMLMNMLWKMFLLKVIRSIIPPPLNQLIPEEICTPNSGAQAKQQLTDLNSDMTEQFGGAA